MVFETRRSQRKLMGVLGGAAFAFGLSAGSAMATTVTLTSDTMTFGGVNVTIGGSATTGIVENPVPAGAQSVGVPTSMSASGILQVYCTDIFHYTSTSQAYTVGSMATSDRQAGPSTAGTWSTQQVSYITALLQNGTLGTQTNLSTASLQIAIWEVEYGTPTGNGTYNLSSGAINFSGYGSGQSLTDSNNAISGATSDLLAVTGTNGVGATWLTNSSTSVTELSNPGNAQNLIYLTQNSGGGGGSNPAPEPSTFALFGVGLAGIWAARRRLISIVSFSSEKSSIGK